MKTRVAETFFTVEWAILPEKYAEIEQAVLRYEGGDKLTKAAIEEELRESITANPARHEQASRESVAVIPVLNTLVNRSSRIGESSGVVSYNSIARQIQEAAANEDITDIILDIDSPGGMVNGIDQVATAIREAREKVNVTAVVNDMAASAAYWIASQADRVVVSRSSTVGSIGVILTHIDASEAYKKMGFTPTVLTSADDKALGHPARPLSPEHKEKLLARIAGTHDLFVTAVASGRDMDKAAVSKLATGGVYSGAEAIENGLADEFGTLASVLRDLEGQSSSESAPIMSETAKQPTATAPQAGNDVAELKEQVSALTASVTALAEMAKGQMEQQKAAAQLAKQERAQNLINPLLEAGALTPAQAEEMIESATENYQLVETVVKNLVPNAAVPFKSVIGQENNPRGRADITGPVAEVYSQLGILGLDGKLDLSGITLPLNSNGEVAEKLSEAAYTPDRVNKEVQMAVGAQLGSWK